MDIGTWIYWRHNVVMKDRSAPVSLHIGPNQSTINHKELAATVARIEQKTYDKILARELDTERTAYDFLDRGSGVKAAIWNNYREVRRIARLKDVTEWWPRHMVEEIIVLVPKSK
jgi:hypothetical protein